jgi:hypothetical protein
LNIGLGRKVANLREIGSQIFDFVGEGEQITSSPDGKYQQVRDKDGKQTGARLDKGGHKGQADLKAQRPHAHVPGVTDSTGNPHLPVNEPKVELEQ